MRLISAAYVIPIRGPILPQGAVAVDEGRILAVGTRSELAARYSDAQPEDFPNAVLMPGLVNAHTQLDLLNFDGKGTAGEALDFFDFLMKSWAYRKKLTPAGRRQGLDEGIRQLLRSGTTCVGDTGQYVGVIPQAANSPMRMVLFPELISGVDLDSFEGTFSQVDEILDCKSTRLSAGLAPYAAYTLSRQLLKILVQHARELRIPCKMHVSETFAEMQFFYESSGEIAEKIFPALGWANQLPPEHRKTPVQYLDSIGFLEGTTIVGGNHLAEGDLQTIAKNKARVVHCPRANARLKLGHPPIRKLRELGVRVALGTDGPGALYSLSLWDEMRYVLNHYPESDRPTPDDLLAMATREGAKALDLEDRIGTLEPGKEADLIAVQLPAEFTPETLAAALIANTTDREIAAVFVEGKKVKL